VGRATRAPQPARPCRCGLGVEAPEAGRRAGPWMAPGTDCFKESHRTVPPLDSAQAPGRCSRTGCSAAGMTFALTRAAHSRKR
jgi:hypothetical protein